jgi:hypothetical protein
MEIENVSLVLHFSIPDALPSDEVNVIMQNHGSDILVSTFAKTLGAVNRMVNPLIINLDDHIDWDWSKLEQTQFNVDYVSDNQGEDDSEVRVDAVGLKVKYHQPWFSFENSKGEHSTILTEVPIIDFDVYGGEISGLMHSTCGLVPSGQDSGTWEFIVAPPPNQSLGRIHVYGEGDYRISFSQEDSDVGYLEVENGHKIDSPLTHHVRVELEDGCISGARADINDPQLIVHGRVSGSLSGLSESSSHIRFAIGNNLVHTEEMKPGQFTISVPIGHALPSEGEELRVGVAARFQWSSNGTAENTVVHIGSMSISGGFSIDWDRDPFCEEIGDLSLVEDEGGQTIYLAPICSDDITETQNLVVSVLSSDESLLKASVEGTILIIEPEEEANGLAEIVVTVMDESGNWWEDSFSVAIQEVYDAPEIVYLPSSIYIELGGSKSIVPGFFDPDTGFLSVSTSKSWATVQENGSILVEPVEDGEHLLKISVSDGTSEVSRNVTIIVTAKPDLLVESVEIRVGGVETGSLDNGDVVELIGFIRNQGRGSAENVTFYCRVDGVLIGTGLIPELSPGALKMAICDLQLMETSGNANFIFEIDGTDSVDETLEGNNILEINMPVEYENDGNEGTIIGTIIMIVSLMAILISLAAIQLGPKSLKKEFQSRK